MTDTPRAPGSERTLALILLFTGGLAWLWPIGLGGKMPVGGDVTQFSIGLMAFLGQSIRSARLPIWNDLWGFGFPGLGESQMGVYYPPHLLLYGLLSTEKAYTLSLVIHTLWGALGTYWAGRKLSLTPTAAALAGFAWSASGFFLIHLPHQWGYTTGSWMPWAWGLAWIIARGRRTRYTPYLLAVALTLQVLPGHFQLAFITQLSVLLIGLHSLVGCGQDRLTRHTGVATLFVVLAAVPLLGALQLWPTWRLAQWSNSERDWGYLSGFATTPLHLVSLLAPGLFQRSPLWRPLVWDPWHTAPEEHLVYVGLVPLFLAWGAVRRGWRSDPAVRLLTFLALATLLLSLGPYVPGFDLWRRLPGFSFFRAPARWGSATSLALSLLAGKGFDRWRTWPKAGRSLASFAAVAAALPLVVLVVIEVALVSTERPGWPVVASGFERAWRALPWSGDPGFREVMVAARRPQQDLRTRFALARQGESDAGIAQLTFTKQRFRIYAHELRETGTILAALLLLSLSATRPRVFATGLVVLTALDLGMLGRHRAVDFGPLEPLTMQSRVLGALGREPRRTRTVDASRNLSMVAGAAPIEAYRTLDVTSLISLTHLAHDPLTQPLDPAIILALRATGTGVRVLDPFETVEATRSGFAAPGWENRETIEDRTLAGWLYGSAWVSGQGPWASTFTLWRPTGSGARAWLVPLTSARSTEILGSWPGEPKAVLALLGSASPLTTKVIRPEQVELDVVASGPSVVVLSQLADPQWRARWIGPAGDRPAEVMAVFRRRHEGGWQAVSVPGPGHWTLRLNYQASDVQEGLIISAVAWLCGIVMYLRHGGRTINDE